MGALKKAHWNAGKGAVRRPGDTGKFRDNYDRIFSKPKGDKEKSDER